MGVIRLMASWRRVVVVVIVEEIDRIDGVVNAVVVEAAVAAAVTTTAGDMKFIIMLFCFVSDSLAPPYCRVLIDILALSAVVVAIISLLSFTIKISMHSYDSIE